jgi:predicted RNase H-like HicB family nuclease
MPQLAGARLAREEAVINIREAIGGYLQVLKEDRLPVAPEFFSQAKLR